MDKRYQDQEIKEKENREGQGEEEIDLRELIEALLRRKWAIITLMVVAVLVAGIFTVFVQREEYVSTVIKMDFEEIEEGEYPDGISFSTGDMISPYILSRAVDELQLGEYGIGVQDLRGMIEVRELFYAVDEDDEEPEPAYQYRLTLQEEEISPSLKRQILSSVVENYRREYSQAFIERPFFPRLSEEAEDVMGLDYPFRNRNLEAYQEMFLEHIDELREEIAADRIFTDLEEEIELFYSSEHGMSFEDLKRRVERLKETSYAEFSALIKINSLTEDPEGAIRHYESMIEELEISEAKKRQEAEYALGLLDDARPLRTGRLPEMFPSMIEEGDRSLVEEIFDTLYRDNFYPQLIQVSMEAAEDSIESSHEIKRLQTDIERMEELDNNPRDTEELMERADELTLQVVSELNELVNINNEMMEKYYQDRAEAGISYAMMPYHDVETGNLELNVALAGVLGLMIGVFGAFFHEFWTKSEKRDRDKERDEED